MRNSGSGFRNSGFSKPCRRFWCMLKFVNHYTRLLAKWRHELAVFVLFSTLFLGLTTVPYANSVSFILIQFSVKALYFGPGKTVLWETSPCPLSLLTASQSWLSLCSHYPISTPLPPVVIFIYVFMCLCPRLNWTAFTYFLRRCSNVVALVDLVLDLKAVDCVSWCKWWGWESGVLEYKDLS